MRDVGNVYLQFEGSVLQPAHGYRVIEVTSRFAVDRDNRQLTKVPSQTGFMRWNERLRVLRLLQHLCRETMRKVEFADHDLDIHAEIILISENLQHAATWTLG